MNTSISSSAALTTNDSRFGKPKSSGELLKYVLETAPEGSLKDLTETVYVDTKKDRILGRGGFSDVYEGSIPISGKNVVIKLFRLHCEGLDGVKVSARDKISFILRITFC